MKIEKEPFAFLDEFGSKHWWYRAKNDLIKTFLKKYANGAHAGKVIDVGCGAGNLSKEITDAGYNVTSVDLSEEAIKYCRARGLKDLHVADAVQLPFQDNCFDAAVASEILEHIEEDSRALKEIYRVLKPGGVAIITVPAVPLLYGYQDKYWRHIRRYSKKGLCDLIQKEPFEILRLTYSNFLLFLPVAAFRFFSKIFYNERREQVCDEARFNNILISAFLGSILNLEKIYLGKHNFLIGTSLVAILKKA